ncbi:MAG: cyclic nucleotide-binding domain-containing protein [Candidatus Dormibacteria bacterium]
MFMVPVPDTKVEVLKRVPLFAGATRRQLTSLAGMMDEIAVAPGSVLVRQGRQGHSFYVMVDGEAVACSGETTVATLGPGDFFGEISMIDRGPAVATVTTRSEATLMVLSHDQFRRLMQSDPDLEVAVARAMADRLARNAAAGLRAR